jgi:hypothetical protein
MVERRTGETTETELEALYWTFTSGHDFEGKAQRWLGWPSPFATGDGWIERQRKKKAKIDKLTREAWGKHGRAFMAAWEPTAARERPYALERWGEPWRRG